MQMPLLLWSKLLMHQPAVGESSQVSSLRTRGAIQRLTQPWLLQSGLCFSMRVGTGTSCQQRHSTSYGYQNQVTFHLC